MIEVIAEHSVDTSLLNGGVCIDVGCLGFKFSEEMRNLGLEVYAFDIQDLMNGCPEKVIFVRAAVTDKSGTVKYMPMCDKQAMYVTDNGLIEVNAIALNDIYKLVGDNVDLLKLDAEGSEYHILSDENFRPVPKQISIEFHFHCHPNIHNIYYKRCMDNLLKYYVPIKHELTEAHGAGLNFWDSIFIRKDLIK